VAIPPGRILECRALLELYNDLRRERTAWAQRIHAVLFHQGAPALDQGALRTEQGMAALRAAAVAHLSAAGQLQVATALEVIDALEARLHVVRHQLTDAARHLAGANALAARLYGVGPVTALAITCWLAGAGRFSSSRQAVRFAGLDPRPHLGAGPPVLRRGQGPQEQQARRPVRGPQDPPPGPSHPGRTRRRRARRRLTHPPWVTST
jgi:transposase